MWIAKLMNNQGDRRRIVGKGVSCLEGPRSPVADRIIRIPSLVTRVELGLHLPRRIAILGSERSTGSFPATDNFAARRSKDRLIPVPKRARCMAWCVSKNSRMAGSRRVRASQDSFRVGFPELEHSDIHGRKHRLSGVGIATSAPRSSGGKRFSSRSQTSILMNSPSPVTAER